MNVLSLFDGMSCGQIALQRAGIKVDKYYAAEIDPYAMQVAKKNWPEMVHLGDVENWRDWDIDWSTIDLVIGGSPCQGFSLQGKQLNFDDSRSVLFFTFVDILCHVEDHNPNVQFLLENVKMKPASLDIISEYLNVQPVKINSVLLSCQHRTRFYWANFGITQPEDKGLTVQQVLETDLHAATVRKGDPRPVIFTGDKATCLTATYYKGIRPDGRPALAECEGVFDELREVGKVRQLTPVECERLQTVPDNYTEGVSNTQRYKMLGNGWTVDVIAHVFGGLHA